MIRALLITAMAAALLGACSQTGGNGDASFRHGGNGPPFSSRILP